jgi:hypothetical protein
MTRRRDEEARAEIARRRQRVEDRLAAVRAALVTETGRAPVRRGWLVAMVAAATGLAVALRRRRAGELAARGEG